MKTKAVVDELLGILTEHGGDLYGGEAVTQLQHALQCAHLAEQDQQPASLVVAALLHDIGHLIHDLGDDPAAQGVSDAHEMRGQRLLTRHFDDAVVAPVQLHVDAKRYLCRVEVDYHASLSPASQQSLALQGGAFTDAEAETFMAQAHAEAAVQLRRYDDLAKDADAVTPDIEHFRGYLQACLNAG